jgi:hypothetical protein
VPSLTSQRCGWTRAQRVDIRSGGLCVAPLPDGRMLSWAAETYRLWDAEGAPISWTPGAAEAKELRALALAHAWGASRALPPAVLADLPRPLSVILSLAECVDDVGIARRVIALGGVRVDGVQTTDSKHVVEAPCVVRVGKVAARRIFGRGGLPDAFVVWLSAAARGAAREEWLACACAGRSVRWYSEGHWVAEHLLPDGTIAATCGPRLTFLHIQHGNRRVSVEEAEAIVGASRVHAPAPSVSTKPP